MTKYLIILFLAISGCSSKPLSAIDYSRVLLIGDSISISYEPKLQSLISPRLLVRASNDLPDGNCRNSLNSAINLSKWLDRVGRIDVAIFNAGIWDAKANINDYDTYLGSSDTAYRANLIKIVTTLKSRGVRRIIFLTTTPIASYTSVYVPGREDELNAIAREVMAIHNVEVHELGDFSKSLQVYMTDDVHFNSTGAQIQADWIFNNVFKEYL